MFAPMWPPIWPLSTIFIVLKYSGVDPFKRMRPAFWSKSKASGKHHLGYVWLYSAVGVRGVPAGTIQRWSDGDLGGIAGGTADRCVQCVGPLRGDGAR